MPSNRTQRRKKVKLLKKQLKSKMSHISEMLSKLPETCHKCENKFSKEDKGCLEWKVKVSNKDGIIVTCPDCLL